MREKTLKSISDKLMWYILYLLPVILWLVYSLKHDLLPFDNFLSLSGFNVLSDSAIFTVFSSLCGENGFIPMFADDSFVLFYMSYFVCVVLVHLAVDVIVFVPRSFHYFLNKFNGGDLLD